MRFSLYTELQNPPGKAHAQTYGELLEAIEQADRLGYHNFSLVEHPWFEQFSISANPLAVFSAAAQRTRQIRFRTALHTLPLHNPLRLAGEIAVADILTGGRLEVGLGRGHAWLYPPGQVPVAASAGRFAEVVEVLLRAWTEERFSFAGEHFQFADVSVVPKPLQRPHPPIVTGGGSDRSQRQAGERGWSLMVGPFTRVEQIPERVAAYREACARHGHTPDVIVARTVYLDRDPERATADARDPLVRFLRWQAAPVVALPPRDELLAANWLQYASNAHAEYMTTTTYEQAIADGVAYVGTPKQVAAQIAAAWGALAIDELGIIAHFGGLAHWQVLRTQELFAQEVVPLLARRGLANRIESPSGSERD
jgi:alkanesulfonate monooxygenase SsuD/methylene tetrahydromethanopterin reductase-like flavin-dependent oxidoreductase (luciferase family)